MSSVESLSELLEELETDSQLQRIVKKIQTLRKDLSGMRKSETKSLYEKKIEKGLEIIARKYIFSIIKKKFPQLRRYCILLNYSSTLDQYKQERILARKIFSQNEGQILSDYINTVIRELWPITKHKTNFQLHEFAQSDLGKKSKRNRIPINILCIDNSSESVYSQKRDYNIVENNLEFLKFVIPTKIQNLKEFDSKFNEFSQFIHKYNKEYYSLETYYCYLLILLGCNLNEKVFDYICKELDLNLKTIKKLNICRKLKSLSNIQLWIISVSDELSNEPLGTIMIFSQDSYNPILTRYLHEITFEFLDAVRKVDIAVSSSREKAKEMFRLINHEVRNLTAKINISNDLDEIKFLSNYLDIVSKSSKSLTLSEEPTVIKKQEFEDIIRNLEKYSKGVLKISELELLDLYYDPRLLFIITEIVRNGEKHSSFPTNANIDLKIYTDFNRRLCIRCISQPHYLSNPKNIISKKNDSYGVDMILEIAHILNYKVSWKAINESNDNNKYCIIFELKGNKKT